MVACEVTLAFALYALVRVTDLPSVGACSYAGLVLVAAVYAGAYRFVYRDGWAWLRRRTA